MTSFMQIFPRLTKTHKPRINFQSTQARNSITDIPSLQKEHMLAFAVGIWGRSDGLGTSSCFSCVKCSQHNETKAFMQMQKEKGFEKHQGLSLHGFWSRESSWGGHYVWKAIFTASYYNNGIWDHPFKKSVLFRGGRGLPVADVCQLEGSRGPQLLV